MRVKQSVPVKGEMYVWPFLTDWDEIILGTLVVRCRAKFAHEH